MARVYFLYRSTKDRAALKVRLQLNSNKEQFEATTNIYTLKGAWKKKKNLTGEEKNQLVEDKIEIKRLEKFVLEKYVKEQPNPSNKEWLKQILDEYYNKRKTPKAPSNLVEFIDHYIQEKKNNYDIKDNQIKRINTTKNKIIRLQNYYNTYFKVEDVNEDFKTKYVQFSNEFNYSLNTQSKDMERIKTICRNASKKGIPISKDLDDLKIKSEKTAKIYFTPDEVEKIRTVKLNHEHLNNARNWLLVSIYTGQRISDFMRFNKNMIVKDEKRSFIKFEQMKTGKSMYIPVSKELGALLNSIHKDFPRPISDQKYNDYIKEVCKLAGINKICRGKKRVCIAEEGKKPTRYDYRNVLGDFPKWQLVSSHIGRRTFATNNYGTIPTPYLIYITGHHSEFEFLNYIVLPDYERAKQAYDHFN